MMSIFIQFHNNLFFWLNNFLAFYPDYEKLVYLIAEKIDNYVIILAVITLFFFLYHSSNRFSLKRFRFLTKEAGRILVAVSVSWLVSFFIKEITQLPRPFLRFPDEVNLLFEYGGFDSFPSGHATLFMALAIMMSLHHRRIGYIFMFLAIIISVARVVAGIHSPVDILFGWILGAGISLFVYKKIVF